MKTPRDQWYRDRILDRARADLGEPLFDEAWQRSETMTVEQALQQAAANLAQWTAARHDEGA